MAAKCYIGYGDVMSHIQMKHYENFRRGTDYNTIVKQLPALGHGGITFALRLYKKEDGNDIFYLPTTKQCEKIGIDPMSNNISTCRESIRTFYGNMYRYINRVVKKNIELDEFNEHISIGVKIQNSNRQQIGARIKRIVKLFNMIEDHFNWEGRTEIYHIPGKNILLLPDVESQEETKIKNIWNEQNKPKFRELMTKTTSFYMFRPAKEWLLTSYTMSLFMLFMRMGLKNRYGTINNYKKFEDEIQKILSPYKNSVYNVNYNMCTHIITNDFMEFKDKDDNFLIITKPYLETFLKNIRRIGEKAANKPDKGDNLHGIFNFIKKLLLPIPDKEKKADVKEFETIYYKEEA